MADEKNIDVAGLDGNQVSLTQQDLLRLQSGLDGPLLRPGDSGWNDAVRLWNAMITKTPALVVQPTSSSDVAAAVNFARQRGLLLSVKCGGHNIAGTAIAAGGLLLAPAAG